MHERGPGFRATGDASSFSRIFARGCLLLASSLFLAGPGTFLLAGAGLAEEAKQAVDEGLSTFLERFDEPQFIRVTDRVSLAYAYDLANMVVIEGDDGIILLDTLWKVELAEKVRAAIAQQTDKPIVAIIYSHGHLDHVGGVRAFVPPGSEGNVEIYASEHWQRYQIERVSSRLPHIAYRIAGQLGGLLPDESNIGSSAGPNPREGRTVSFLPPTQTLGPYTELEIAGVKLEIYHMPSELDDELVVWLPEEKVLYSADIVAGVSPFPATPRFEEGRSVDGIIAALERLMEIPAEYLLPGHGRLYSGRDDIEAILLANRDANQFLRDQTIRQLAKNRTRDEAAARVKLPPHLANNPELQERYHRVSWVVKGLYTKLGGGWYGGDPLEMVRHSPREEAARMLALVGGSEAMLAQADNALAKGDAVWAAQLTGYVLVADFVEAPELAHAKATRARAFRALAAESPSANEYNYLLTDALQLEGGVSLDAAIPVILSGIVTPQMYGVVPTETLLRDMGPRLDPGRSADALMTLGFSFPDRDEECGLIVRRGVIQYLPERPAEADVRATLARGALDSVMSGRASRDSLLASGRVEVTGSEDDFRKFVGYFDF